MARPRRWFFAVPPLRALGEAFLVYALLALPLLAFLSAEWLVAAEALARTLALLVFSLRLGPGTGTWWRQLARELGAGLAVSLALALPAALLLSLVAPEAIAQLGRSGPGLPLFGTLLGDHLGALVVSRGLALGWWHLHRLQRTHLQWSLTYASVAFVAVTVLLCGAVMIAALLLSWPNWSNALTVGPDSTPADPLLSLGVTVGVVLLLLLFLLLFLVLAAALPAAFFAWLFTRRTTRRLGELATAAGELQSGALTTRLVVEGEDEVARLQTAFNAMAGDLQRTMGELTAANGALQQERDTVRRLLDERRALVAAVSHELRTPVATARGYLDSALTHWSDAPPPTLRADVQIVERELVRLQRLIDDLFTLARAEVQQLPLAIAPADVGTLLARSVAALAPAAWERGRVEVLAEPPSEELLALADEGRLEQVVRNLGLNAVRHTPPGGVVVLRAQASGEMVLVEVRDTGEGIAPADLPHIFERFFRADAARSADSGGAGLGLALVKELAEAMGGSVQVASTLGKGTIFTLRLPRQR